MIRELSIKQWAKEDLIHGKDYQFVACDGWIEQFLKRHNLSSQLVSKHCSSEPKKMCSDQEKQQLISEYQNKYQTFIFT